MQSHRDPSPGRSSSFIFQAIVFIVSTAASLATMEAGCPPGENNPITSGLAMTPPVFIGGFGPDPQGSFFLLGTGDENSSGDLPTSEWLHNLGDLDGDGLPEYRIEAPGEGAGGWGDPLALGCPSTTTPPHPPLVVVVYQPNNDFDSDGKFDLFEDRNGNRLLDPD